jgi:peptidoglycan/xylan/chitin deacetylase (PgdA/CDA1 family)
MWIGFLNACSARRSALAIVLLSAVSVCAQPRAVAITVDDLPYVRGPATTDDLALAESVNARLLAAFRKHHVPVTGFVIQKRVDDLGALGQCILQQWTAQGLELGNHTYSHPDINALSVAQIKEEIVRGEASLGPKPAFFRFPMNHTGDTKEKHDAVATFLGTRGYSLATCTIDNSDYIFNDAYVRILAANDAALAEKLRREYLAYTAAEIDYYAALHKQVFGYEPPQVMLLHTNRLNADVIDSVLEIFEKKPYRFVSLAMAQSDDAYRTPDTFITKFGPMWGYRWAAERGVKVNGALEPDPPAWVAKYGR